MRERERKATTALQQSKWLMILCLKSSINIISSYYQTMNKRGKGRSMRLWQHLILPALLTFWSHLDQRRMISQFIRGITRIESVIEIRLQLTNGEQRRGSIGHQGIFRGIRDRLLIERPEDHRVRIGINLTVDLHVQREWVGSDDRRFGVNGGRVWTGKWSVQRGRSIVGDNRLHSTVTRVWVLSAFSIALPFEYFKVFFARHV